ncbi:MAG: hypothetical protein Q7U47_05735 [Paludibacter sp.]|nr:hypothetical protein [Paludibacter sp.]
MIGYILLLIVAVLFPLVLVYFYLFYPKQTMPVGNPVEIKTPEQEKYKNDCLHPCVRYIPDGFADYNWWMVQSPYYGRDSKLENPILYYSKDKTFPLKWECLGIIRDTPLTGFNSDPTLFYEDNKLWIFWREYLTPLCEHLKVTKATVGFSTLDGIKFNPLQVYLTETESDMDREQCPILIKRNDKYLFYAVHYQYKPVRKSLGIVIWEGTSLEHPDFRLKETIKMKPVFICDKWKQLKIANKIFFLPKPLKHDLWHFDLFEYKNKLYIFSVAEWGDNIMLSVSEDYKSFKTIRKPLINAHFTEQHSGYRQYYYKPTGFIANDILYLYFTAIGKEDKNRNELFFTKAKLTFEIVL